MLPFDVARSLVTTCNTVQNTCLDVNYFILLFYFCSVFNIMNSQNLLQDLHFDLTSSDSPHVTGPSSPHVPEPSRHRNRKEQTFRCEFLYRSLRTARWVAHSCRRQRSLSTDSYFGSESVCDKLKKSFLKPRTVTEEEMEHLRLKLAEIKIKDSEQCVENLSKLCLTLGTISAGRLMY